ncbi:unnamed protein product, partial [Amoebophrya sp. A25]
GSRNSGDSRWKAWPSSLLPKGLRRKDGGSLEAPAGGRDSMWSADDEARSTKQSSSGDQKAEGGDEEKKDENEAERRTSTSTSKSSSILGDIKMQSLKRAELLSKERAKGNEMLTQEQKKTQRDVDTLLAETEATHRRIVKMLQVQTIEHLIERDTSESSPITSPDSPQNGFLSPSGAQLTSPLDSHLQGVDDMINVGENKNLVNAGEDLQDHEQEQQGVNKGVGGDGGASRVSTLRARKS